MALYACGTRTATKSDKKKLKVFKIFRKMFDPNDNTKNDGKMEDLYDEVAIARTLRGMKISQAERVWRSRGLIRQITK